MLQALLYRTGKARPLFYRVEISRNLFEEASVTREWGAVGGTPRTITSCHTDLRAASSSCQINSGVRPQAEGQRPLSGPQLIHRPRHHAQTRDQILLGRVFLERMADPANRRHEQHRHRHQP